MKCFTISLPDSIAQASNDTAKALGISRTEFIRQAVTHELTSIQKDKAQKEIIDAFNTMKESREYLDESEDIIEGLEDSGLPVERSEWWSKE